VGSWSIPASSLRWKSRPSALIFVVGRQQSELLAEGFRGLEGSPMGVPRINEQCSTSRITGGRQHHVELTINLRVATRQGDGEIPGNGN